MNYIKIIATFILFILGTSNSYSQGLEFVPPVLKNPTSNKLPKDLFFIFNATKFNKQTQYGNTIMEGSLEIVDAHQPWPPIWFCASDIRLSDTVRYSTSDSLVAFKDLMFDLRYQEDKVTFFKERSVQRGVKPKQITFLGYVICNDKLEPVDTFTGFGKEVNYHELRISDKGEKMAFVKMDTLLDLRNLSMQQSDSAVNSTYDLIEIFDAQNKLVFSWNPVKEMGPNVHHYPYGTIYSYSARPGSFNWSHGNSLAWDFDGNILYSFRHIGVGKISRKDGHIMWRLDRNKMPYIVNGDSLAFYRQHDFAKVSDHDLYTTYSLYSNGDIEHRGAYVLEFDISKVDYKLLRFRKIMPHTKVVSTGSGNYEVDKNGFYIMNYGVREVVDPNDSNPNIFMEYGRNSKVYAEYVLPPRYSSYRVHSLIGWKPPRPEVIRRKDTLMAKGSMNEWIWYKLKGPNNTEVQRVGQGATFTSEDSGVYCVAGKYGIGWAVSLPVIVK